MNNKSQVVDGYIVFMKNFIELEDKKSNRLNKSFLNFRIEITDDYKTTIKIEEKNINYGIYTESAKMIEKMDTELKSGKISYSYDMFKKDITLYCKKYYKYRIKDSLMYFLDNILCYYSFNDFYEKFLKVYLRYPDLNVLLEYSGVNCIMKYIYTQLSTKNENKNIIHSSGYYDISYLVCSKLKGYSDLYFFANCGECSTIGAAISTNLVRVASSRIFSKPHQAIVELIVNSADAYLPANKKKAGRFGMGFFSILYFLLEDSNRTLTIESYYSENGTKKLTLEIKNESGILKFNIVVNYTFAVQKGTTISINGTFSNEDVRLFKYFKNYTKFLNSETLKIDDYSHNYNNITTKIDTDIIQVKDYASGIDLNTVLKSLLIPSSSTKKLSTGLSNENKEDNDVDAGLFYISPQDGVFMITVKKVCVVYIPIGYNCDVVIHLPFDTMIPVTRDDIIIKGNNQKYMDKAMDKLKEECASVKNISILECSIDNYIKQTNNTNNASYMKTKLDNIQKDLISRGYLFMTENQKKILSLILPDYVRYFIVSSYVDTTKIEDFIIEKLGTTQYDKNNIIYNKCLSGIFYNLYAVIVNPIYNTSLFENNRYCNTLGLAKIALLKIDRNQSIEEGKKELHTCCILDNGINLYNKKITSPNDTYKDDRTYVIWYEDYLRSFVRCLLERYYIINEETIRYVLSIPEKSKVSFKLILSKQNTNGKEIIDESNKEQFKGLFNKYFEYVYEIMVIVDESNLSKISEYFSIKTSISELVFKGLINLMNPGNNVENLLLCCKIFIKNTILFLGKNSQDNVIKDSCNILLYYINTIKLDYSEFIKILYMIIDSRIRYRYNLDINYGGSKDSVSFLAHTSRSFLQNETILKIKDIENAKGINILSLIREYLKDYIYTDMLLSSKDAFVYEIRLFPESINTTVYRKNDIFYYLYYWSNYFDEKIKKNLSYYVSLALYVIENIDHGAYSNDIYKELNKFKRDILSPIQPSAQLYNSDVIEKNKEIFRLFNDKYYNLFFNKIIPVGIYYLNALYVNSSITGIIFKRAIINILYKSIKEANNSSNINIKKSSETIEKSSKIIENDNNLQNEKYYDFNLSKLIKDVFIRDIVDLDNIEDHEGEIDLQVISIAIDASTSKPDSEAVLIELYQNSRDAIINTDAPDKTIKIYANIMEKENHSIFNICIKDSVGMSLNNLISMFIPFYSSKKKDEKTTGEMGTGFFNVYRGVNCVNIKTAKYGKYYEITDTVQRDQIYEDIYITKDINKKIKRYNCDKTITGTSITLSYVEPKDSIENIYRFSSLENTIYNILSNIPDDSIEISYNGSTNIVKKHENLLNFTTNNISIYFVDGTISYIYTKGVPFSDLENFMNNMFPRDPLIGIINNIYKMNIIINLGENTYEPVQSRVKVIFNKKNRENFLNAIKSMITFYLLNNIFYNNSEGKNDINSEGKNDINSSSYYFSKSNINEDFVRQISFFNYFSDDIQQVYPTNELNTVSGYFFNYKHPNVERNLHNTTRYNNYTNLELLGIIKDLIEDIIKKVLTEKSNKDIYNPEYILEPVYKAIKKQFGKIYNANATKDDIILRMCITFLLSWIRNKVLKMYKTYKLSTHEVASQNALAIKTNRSRKLAGVTTKVGIINKFLTNYTKNYIDKLKDLQMTTDNTTYVSLINSNLAYPNCEIGVIEDDGDSKTSKIEAFYDKSKNKIVVVYPHGISLNDINLIYDSLIPPENVDKLNANKTFHRLCKNENGASTLCHEIEHWRRGEVHNNNLHASISSRIQNNDYYNNYSSRNLENKFISRSFDSFVVYISHFIDISSIISNSLNQLNN